MQQKTVHDLPDDWQEQIILLYKEGASDTEVRAELHITTKLWQHLLLTDVEFEDLVLYGRTLSQGWWMKQGRTNLYNKSFNANLYNINMQNRFNWNDKTSTKNYSGEEDEVFDSEEDIDQQIAALSDSDDRTVN